MRQLLIALLLAGLASMGEQGTFASFSAVTANGASFRTGSLVLSNKKNKATACLSTNAGSTDVNANDCDVLFNLLAQDGGTSNVRITVANEGSLDASSLRLYWSNGAAPCATVDEPSETYHGTGDLCGTMRLQVQEYPDATAQSGNDRTNGYCWYGGNQGTNACTNNNNKDLAAFSLLDGTGANAIDMGAIASGATRYYRIYVNVPAGQLTNAMQGRRVDFGFTWKAVQ